MKKVITILVAVVVLTFSQFTQAQVIIQDDTTFNTVAQMLLANELFESGEPFAEALGYNLDDLDPEILNTPDSIAYTTGIEGYEYSRYLLNTLTGRSAMGLHMMWSPKIMANAAMQPDEFDGMFTGGTANGYKEDDMLMMMIGNFGMNANQQPPANAFPQFADFMTGNTDLPQAVAGDFQMNFGSTRWDRNKMTKILNLGAMGQSMWKQYYWAQDMLSAFHNGNDEGIEATGTNSPDSLNSPRFDPSNDIFYGGNNADGYIGQVLTAVSINKAAFLINKLAYDGTTLGAVSPATYNPADGIKYFPTKIAVDEGMVMTGLPPKGMTLTVIDAKSQLFDQLSFLLAAVSFRNMMNPNDFSDAAHLAYKEVFDGYPFPADMSTTGMPGPFDLMMGTSKVIFMNTMAMHFKASVGTFVDEASLNDAGQPVMGNTISAENAGYILVALSKFIPEFAGTPLESMANNALVMQSNFVVNSLKDPSGGYFNSFEVGTGASDEEKTLAANAAIIRGLYAAYQSTGNANLLTEANEAYNFLINNFYVPSEMVFRTTLNESEAVYTPWNLAMLSGALREASLVGAQAEAANIYTRVFKKVYNKMILTEAEASGETGGDSDNDGVPYIVGGTKPFVFAGSATYDLHVLGVLPIGLDQLSISVFPNPATDYVTVDLNLKRQSSVNITIFDVTGKVISAVVNNWSEGGHRVNLPLATLPAGNYFIRTSMDNVPVAIEQIIVN